MTASNHPHLLIVESVAAGSRELDALIADLAGRPGFDLYRTRQRLIGRGPNLISEGSAELLRPAADILVRRGWRCWLLPVEAPRLVPTRLRSLQLDKTGLTLFTAEKQLPVQSDSRLVAVLGDLSGTVIDKALKHLMAQKVYNGVDRARPISDDALRQAILLARPVLDLYLLDEDDEPCNALRLLPGRFDPRGLGETMSPSAARNLQVVLEQVGRIVEPRILSLDFGLAVLPGCQVEKATEGVHWERLNLNSFSRFGWLICRMQAYGSHRPVDAAESSRSRPTPPPMQPPAVVTLLEEIREESAPQPPPPEPRGGLPQPPACPRSQGLSRPQWWSIGSGLLGLGVFLLLGNPGPLRPVAGHAIRTGLLPAVLAGICLWWGFHFLRLKRRVENTPTSKTRSLALGLVEVHGRARRKYALVSPMSQQPCVYYRLRRFRRDRNNRWKLSSSSDSGHVPFYLEDDTGRVLVDPARASVRPRSRQEGFSGQQILMLERSSPVDRNQKWVEEIIAEGRWLYVLGHATENRTPRTSLRERLVEALRELKADPAAMRQYDQNGDGQICEQEWSAARKQVEEKLLRQSLKQHNTAAGTRDRVVIVHPKQRSLPFIIAETASEAHLTRSYGLYSLPFFVMALFAVAWALVMLVKYFGLN